MNGFSLYQQIIIIILINLRYLNKTLNQKKKKYE